MHPHNAQFIERLGLFFEDDGAPRIAGRLFGILLLTRGDCSLDDLAEGLQVSKASVSTNARLLEAWGAVERVGRPGDRRDYYRIADDMQGRMLERRIERMRHMHDLIAEGEASIDVQDETVRHRLRTFAEFHAHCIDGMEAGLERLRSRESQRDQGVGELHTA